MPLNLNAKDPSERICATFNDAAFVLKDPSRKPSWVLIQFAKPIPLAQLFDSKVSALEDSIEEEGTNRC